MSASQHAPEDGNHAIGMIVEGEHVIIRFQHPITFLKLDPQNAMEIAGGLVKASLECKTKAPVDASVVQKLLADTKKDIKIDQAREVLINRMILMLNSFATSNKPIDWKARQVVDTILVEVT